VVTGVGEASERAVILDRVLGTGVSKCRGARGFLNFGFWVIRDASLQVVGLWWIERDWQGLEVGANAIFYSKIRISRGMREYWRRSGALRAKKVAIVRGLGGY
jgi:hypothetical protein